MTLRMRWRFGPRPAPVGGSVVIAAPALRVGQTVTVTNTTGFPAFVQVMALGTDTYDEPFIDLDLDNPSPSFTLGPQHMGHMVRVAAYHLDVDGVPNGNVTLSNVIGPILHAVDPVGTTVADATEFAAAVTAGASTIIMAAGTTWDGSVFNRALSNVTITTPQDNPARIVDSLSRPGLWTNVVLEGLVFRYSADFARGNRANVFETGSTTDGVTFRGCKAIGDNVEPAVYQAIPPTLLQSPYRRPGIVPTNPDLPYTVNGTDGMDFVFQGFNLLRSRNITIEGCFVRNVFRGFTFPGSTTIRHLRIDGWYADGYQVNSSQSNQPGDLFDERDYYISKCYGIYDEVDARTNAAGSGDSPHMDGRQGSGGASLVNAVFDRFVNCIGDTRAYAFGGTQTNFINQQFVRNGRFRNQLMTGQGAVSTYMAGSDVSFDYMTKVAFAASGGAVLRFGGGTNGQFWSNEARVNRTISRESVTRTGFPTNGYYVVDPASQIGVGTSGISTRIYGQATQRPKGIAELALKARPRPGFEGLGCLLPSGHMRPYVPLPDAPSLSLVGGVGTFTATLGTASGNPVYEVRYRLTGTTGVWVRPLPGASPVFEVTTDAGTYDVQSFVTTDAGLSGWSAVQTVTVG